MSLYRVNATISSGSPRYARQSQLSPNVHHILQQIPAVDAQAQLQPGSLVVLSRPQAK
jgi:hypothetical protein